MKKLIISAVAILLAFPLSVFAYTKTRAPEIRVFDSDGEMKRNLTVYPEDFYGGVSVASCDIDGNGKDEIIVGAGPGGGPNVKIVWPYSLKITGFLAYAETFRKGVTVACGDLNGDGEIEIVTGSGSGGGPHIRIFDTEGNQKFTPGFFAFGENMRGGVNVAVGDVDGDGKDDIVAAPGSSGGSHVRVFNFRGDYKGIDFFPFREGDRGGVSLAVGNFDGGPEDEIVVAVEKFGKAWTKIYKFNESRTILGEFDAYPDYFEGGIRVGAGDVDNDGFDEVIVAPTRAGGPHVRMFEAHGELIDNSIFAYEEDFRGGVNLASGDITGNGQDDIITAPAGWFSENRPDHYKYIEVNLTEQKLYAYENDKLVDSFLISSGIKGKYDTPIGEYSVFLKRESTDMSWFYGPDDPDNYDLEDVPHVLSFSGAYTIHGTYWHNNFGYRMSHGCVNMSREDSAWLYQWANLGIPVIVHD
ncbi:L,D-transpeptidase [Patescibacteria group bacterium]|nr:L,D-transpeptidase [Patescibacteria group bacterium]